jgi:hypothetical protein
VSDHDRYAEWDAAYVIGALSAADRREFEDHLAGCPQCRADVADLAAMPGLLGGLSRDDAFALLETDTPEPATALQHDQDTAIRPPVDLLPRLQSRVRRHRRARTWTVGTIGVVGLAAAATVVALVLPSVIEQVQHPTVTIGLQQTTPNPITASVRLTDLPWGTGISMTCTYHGSIATYPGYPDSSRYGLYVVDRDGATTQVSSWTALPGRTITTEGSTATPAPQIERIELRDLATGTVLLAHELG